MRAWILMVPAVLAMPVAAGEATIAPSVADLLANIPICGDELPVDTTPRLYPDYGGGGFAVVTRSGQAQAFFDNGMQLGRSAMLEKRPAAAGRAFLKAARLDEATVMKTLSDPPAWWYPVRRSYAAALLVQGNARAALKQAGLVLARRPADPVALSIRADAEDALGMKADAARDRAMALKGWRGDKAALTPTLA